MDKKQARMIVESLPSLYPMMRDVEEEAIWEILAEDINVPTNEDCISRQAAIMDAESWVAVDEYEKHLQKNVVEWLKEFPPAEPEIIECDPVKACNEATMNKVFSAYRYLSMLEDLKVYGYVLAKRRG